MIMCLGSLLFTGVLNLVAVSYDRLTAIVTPLEARMTVHGAHIVMAFTWVTGVILGLPLVFFRIYRVRFRIRSYWENLRYTLFFEKQRVFSVLCKVIDHSPLKIWYHFGLTI